MPFSSSLQRQACFLIKLSYGSSFLKESFFSHHLEVDNSLIRTLLLVIILFLGASSPDLRNVMAKALRITATWVEPKNSPETNPRNFQIPNPFYVEERDL